MSVIPSPQRHRSEEPASVRPLNREARIQGTFRSPSGGRGTMTGWLRLERFHVISDRLCAAGVFTGELVDSKGTTIGVGSRRRTVPVEIARSLHDMAVVIGPVDVDLLGLTVSIPAFTVGTAVVRRPLMKPDAERSEDVRADREGHPSHGRGGAEAGAVPEGPHGPGSHHAPGDGRVHGRAGKDGPPRFGSTESVEKGRGRRHRVTPNSSSANVNPV